MLRRIAKRLFGDAFYEWTPEDYILWLARVKRIPANTVIIAEMWATAQKEIDVLRKQAIDLAARCDALQNKLDKLKP